ncbi:hypothetical protein HYDPIDRAFT_170285 [Hydnomerulius pinastri MD-312]|uniref:Enoyl reductase (ER) domain-containing protein n=1 Tax=Hydnomerulius pinastri MD-312 TaxID=994086 RepID=A0A0C9WAU3_9AGAM|nr:hypothetical protein HYDPIDRAFT_170285 [Hydnomerulius pinastri MD-312]
MSSQQQKALFLQSKQGKFAVGQRNIPKPGQGQLLVKIHSTALNPVDYKIQETGIFVENYPAVLGSDIAGTVEEVGEGVHNFSKGDKVFAHGSFADDQSSYQQFAIAVADFAAKIPNNLDFDHAATVPLAYDTAAVGLYSEKLGAGLTPPWAQGGKGKYSGKPILIVGGSSSVGTYAIQLARESGFSPIITTASPAHESYLKSLGVTDFISRHLSGEELTAALNKVTKAPVEIVFDAISLPETQQAAWTALAQNGTLILTLQPVVKEDQGKGRRVVATHGSPHAQANQALGQASWKILEEWLKTGVIKPNRFEVLPNGLNGIDEGLQRMRAGKVSGTKLVAHPQETKVSEAIRYLELQPYGQEKSTKTYLPFRTTYIRWPVRRAIYRAYQVDHPHTTINVGHPSAPILSHDRCRSSRGSSAVPVSSMDWQLGGLVWPSVQQRFPVPPLAPPVSGVAIQFIVFKNI